MAINLRVGDAVNLKHITSYMCKKFFGNENCDISFKKSHIAFDYFDKNTNKAYFHMRNFEMYENRIEKPDDFRGFWNCNCCYIRKLKPLQFEVDGLIFTPYICEEQ